MKKLVLLSLISIFALTGCAEKITADDLKTRFVVGDSVSCQVSGISYKDGKISVSAKMTAITEIDPTKTLDTSNLKLTYGGISDDENEYRFTGRYVYELTVDFKGNKSLVGENIPSYISFYMYPETASLYGTNNEGRTFDGNGNCTYTVKITRPYVVTGIDINRVDK